MQLWHLIVGVAAYPEYTGNFRFRGVVALSNCDGDACQFSDIWGWKICFTEITCQVMNIEMAMVFLGHC